MTTAAKAPRPTLAQRKQTRQLVHSFTKPFLQGNVLMLALACFAMLVNGGFNLYISIIMQQLIDIAAGTDTAPLFVILRQTLLIFACLLVVFAMQCVVIPRFLRRAMAQYREHAFAEITRKSISTFATESTSRYISALTNDAVSIETNYLSKVFSLVQQSVMFVGALVLMVYYSPTLTVISLLLALLPLLASVLTAGKLAQAEKEVSDSNERFMGTVRDMLNGFTVVKSFRAEKEAIALMTRDNRALEDSKCRRRTAEEAISMLGQCAAVISQIGVFFIGTYMAVTGQGVTAGVVIVFVQLMAFVLEPLSTVPGMLAGRKAAMALVEKLADAVQTSHRREGRMVDGVLDEGVSVDHVSFAYEPGKPVLRDLTCRFDAGKSYAVVGGSGSGKSTLLNLLMGAMDGFDGAIRYDGDEVRDIASDALFNLVSIVQQNVFVFNDTIRNNITMFRDFPQEQVDRAIERSGLKEVIARRGLDMLCGENGSELSGGEKQRLSIARCLLRRTPILLIDEATAALDAATAYEVTEAILDIAGLTRIVVTHRLEEKLLRRYDRILVLRGGRIAEEGTFDDLMAGNGYFRSLFTVSQDNAG